MGKFWLNKIGIILFSLGVAFLFTYAFTHLEPFAKILLGYLIAGTLFILGVKFEKIDRFINYGRVLLGGGWAIVYFTTYAMYHFEASKIINSQILDLFLLLIVAFGIIVHSLQYKSENLIGVALFIGYFTSVIGDVKYFTLISTALLAVIGFILVYKMRWFRFIFLGIILTYFTHFEWVIKQISFSRIPVGNLNVENVYFLLDAGFLLIYWIMFTLAIHLIRNNGDIKLDKKIAIANLTNLVLFLFMIYPKVYFFYPSQKFNFIFGLGLVYTVLSIIMYYIKRNDIFICDIIIAISLLTISIPLKFLPYHTTIIWFVELPFLLLAGFIFEQKAYRYIGLVLASILFLRLRLIFPDCYVLPNDLKILSFLLGCPALLYFIGFISTAVCFSLYYFLYNKKDTFNSEAVLQNFYSGFSVMYLTMYIGEVVKPFWITFSIFLESLLLLILGILILDKYIRLYALMLLVWASLRFCFYDNYRIISGFQKLFLVYGPIVCAFGEYFIYRFFKIKFINDSIKSFDKYLVSPIFYVGSCLAILAIFKYIKYTWVSLGLGILGVFLFLIGFLIKEKNFRQVGFIIFGFTLLRVGFVDLFKLSVIYKIISFIILGLIFLGISFIYTKYAIEKLTPKKE
ncbi:MAG: DUF2339 domain-containing protein [Candidatus Omnitrophica bacterium]|nr:DUF2339 domain-containing protein [Candidatus Omnitrophota bacterium]